MRRSVRVIFGAQSRLNSITSHHGHIDRVSHIGNVQALLPQHSLIIDSKKISFWGSPKPPSWDKAVSDAEKIVGYSTSFMSLRCLLSDELSNVALHMRKLVGTKHPLLKTARKFFYDGKHSMQTRGLLVLLISKAAGASPSDRTEENMVSGIYPSQRSLGEITEMINTANLIHKGVLNLTDDVKSSESAADMEFGNKMAVLSGDFLLANASTALAALNNTYVVELISKGIGDLTKAEFTRLRDDDGNPLLPGPDVTMEDWYEQAYLSSGSLIANSCKAAVLLADHPTQLQEDAFVFGKQISYARQLHEDLLPFTKGVDENGSFGVTSAPVLLHVMRNPGDSISEQLLQNNLDLSKIVKLLKDTPAIEETKHLCRSHGNQAIDSLDNFKMSDAKSGLENIVKAVSAS